MPKVLSIVSKKVKEATAYMQEALAETMGLMVYFIVNKVGSMGLEAANQESINDSRLAKLEEAQH